MITADGIERERETERLRAAGQAVTQAQAHLAEQAYEAAIRTANEALALVPDHPEVVAGIARCSGSTRFSTKACRLESR